LNSGSASLLHRLKDTHIRELLRGALVAFALKGLGTCLGFGFNILLARKLGAEGAGIYFLAFALMNLAAVLGRFGVDTAMVRFVSVGVAKQNLEAVKGASINAQRIVLAASILMALILFSSSSWVSSVIFSKPSLEMPIRILSIAVVPFALLSLYSEMLRGLRRIKDSQLAQMVLVPGIACVCFLLLNETWGMLGAAWAYVLAVMVAMTISIVIWYRATPQYKNIVGRFELTTLMSTSLPLMWVASMLYVNGWISTLILGLFSEGEQIGIFNAAQRTAMLTGIILLSVNSISAPMFAAFHKTGDMKDLERLAVRATRLMTFVSAPIVFVCLLAPAWVLGIFGTEYRTGADVLRVLAVGQFFNVATGSVGQLLAMTGHEKILRNIISSSALLNLILCTILIPWYGINGAALAVVTSSIYSSLLASYMVLKKLGISAHVLTLNIKTNA